MPSFITNHILLLRSSLICMGLLFSGTFSHTVLAEGVDFSPRLLDSADYFDSKLVWSRVVGAPALESARAQKMNYDQAVAYCKSKTEPTGSKWRLPTKNELEFFGRKRMLVVQQDTLQRMLEMHGWNKMEEGMWSSTTNDNGGTYYVGGGVNPYGRWVQKSATEYVTCVMDPFVTSFDDNRNVTCSNGLSANFWPTHAGTSYDYTNGTRTFYTPMTRFPEFRQPSTEELRRLVGEPFCQMPPDTSSSDDHFDSLMTKLTWSKITDVQRMDYDTALKYCAFKKLSTHGNQWRLPTKNEVKATLSVTNNDSGWIYGGNNVWTSSHKKDDNFRYVVGNANPELTNRSPFSELQKKDQTNYVTCVLPIDAVRDSKVESPDFARTRYTVTCTNGKQSVFTNLSTASNDFSNGQGKKYTTNWGGNHKNADTFDRDIGQPFCQSSD